MSPRLPQPHTGGGGLLRPTLYFAWHRLPQLISCFTGCPFTIGRPMSPVVMKETGAFFFHQCFFVRSRGFWRGSATHRFGAAGAALLLDIASHFTVSRYCCCLPLFPH